jgi:HlyD family secretion protein
MARKRRWLLIAIAAAVPVAVLLVAVRGGRDRGTEVMAAVASSGPLESRASGSGTLEGVSRVEISAARMGIIDSITVEEGDTVSAGDLLLVLETDEARAALDEAGAASYSAGIALTQAQRTEDRIRTLYEAGLASEEEVLLAGEAEQTAMAAVMRASAAGRTAQDGLDETSYRSPISGIVTALNVERGEMAVVGTMNNPGTVLMTVEDMSGLLVRVTMVESEVVDVMPGMAAEVTLDAMSDTTFAGRVVAVGYAATNELETRAGEVAEYEVTVELSDPDPRMRSGMSASVEIITASRDSCLHIPVQCVIPRPEPSDTTRDAEAVLRIDDGVVETVFIETGIMGVMDVEVAGLSEGDSVVSGPVEALRDLRDGDRVRTADGRHGRRRRS